MQRDSAQPAGNPKVERDQRIGLPIIASSANISSSGSWTEGRVWRKAMNAALEPDH
jgi:hypothetical protein